MPHWREHPEGSSDGVGTEQAWVYILRCADGSLYTGWTFDLEVRIAAHNSGRGAKYTAGRRPVELVYFEKAGSRNDALRRERAIKKMSRNGKEKLFLPVEGIPLVPGGVERL